MTVDFSLVCLMVVRMLCERLLKPIDSAATGF